MLAAMPLFLGFLSVMFKKQAKAIAVAGVQLNALMVFSVEKGIYHLGNHTPPYGIVLVIDSYSLYAIIALNLMFAALILLNLPKLAGISSVLLIALAGLNGLLMTGDLFNLFVFLEISVIAAFIIVSVNKRLHHLFNYMVIAMVGSSMYLFGVILLYSQYGTLNMGKMSEEMAKAGDLVNYIPVIMIFCGLAVETKLLPFNGWVKGVLGHSDSLVGALIGSIYSGVMLMVFGRLFTHVFPMDDEIRLLLSTVAVLTVIAGEFSAFQP